MHDFMAFAIKRPRKGRSLKIAVRAGTRRNDCLRKDLPAHINIRRQDKALVIVVSIGGQGQQVIFSGDLVGGVWVASAAGVFGKRGFDKLTAG